MANPFFTVPLLTLATLSTGFSCATQQPGDVASSIDLAASRMWKASGIITSFAVSDDSQQEWLFASIGGEVPRLITLDLSDPDEPTRVGILDYPSEEASLAIKDLSVEGAFLYASLVGPGGGLWIVNVAEPWAPTHVGFVETPSGLLKQVVVQDGIVLMAGGFSVGPGSNPVLVTIDASHPSSPFVTSESSDWISGAHGIAFEEGIAYVAAPDALYVVDPSDLRSPLGVFSLPRPSRGDHLRVISAEQVEEGYASYTPEEYLGAMDGMVRADVAVYGDYAYVASDSEGLRIIDVSNSANMREVGVLDAPGANHILLRGNTAFVRLSGSRNTTNPSATVLLAVDVSQPESPKVLGSLDVEHPGVFAAAGERLYIVNGPDEVLTVSHMDTE